MPQAKKRQVTITITETDLGFDCMIEGDDESIAWDLANWLWDECAKSWEDKEVKN